MMTANVNRADDLHRSWSAHYGKPGGNFSTCKCIVAARHCGFAEKLGLVTANYSNGKFRR